MMELALVMVVEEFGISVRGKAIKCVLFSVKVAVWASSPDNEAL